MDVQKSPITILIQWYSIRRVLEKSETKKMSINLHVKFKRREYNYSVIITSLKKKCWVLLFAPKSRFFFLYNRVATKKKK